MAHPLPEYLDPTRYHYGVEISTRFADLDPNGHINNVAMAAAFEDARARYDRSIGILELASDIRFVIAATDIAYIAEAYYPAPLTVHVGVVKVGRSSWAMAELAMQDGRPRAFCMATMVALSGDRSCPFPPAFKARLEAEMIG